MELRVVDVLPVAAVRDAIVDDETHDDHFRIIASIADVFADGLLPLSITAHPVPGFTPVGRVVAPCPALMTLTVMTR